MSHCSAGSLHSSNSPREASWIREVDLWHVYRQKGGVTASFLFEDRGEGEGMDLIFARPGVSFWL